MVTASVMLAAVGLQDDGNHDRLPQFDVDGAQHRPVKIHDGTTIAIVALSTLAVL
jgi:hypothetical protein